VSVHSILSGGLLVGTGARGGYLSLLTRGLLTSNSLFEIPSGFIDGFIVADLFVQEDLVPAAWDWPTIQVNDGFALDDIVPDGHVLLVEVPEDEWVLEPDEVPDEFITSVFVEDGFE
jgi:hypothetical protein